MRKLAQFAALAIVVPLTAALAYAGDGYFDAKKDAKSLRERADRLIAEQRGAAGLGPTRLEQLLLVEDPSFARHSGVDFSTPGAGLTTLTQSVGKRVGFEHFRPGIRKIRLVGYAMGLERSLSKQQIIALYLATVEMGRGPNGWMTGFFEASHAIYGRPPARLSDREFLSLLAVPITPRDFDLQRPSEALVQRVNRIERLVNRQCQPRGLRDVWLEGCAAS